MRIVKERKRREVEPVLNALNELREIEDEGNSKEVKVFTDVVNDIQKFANQASKGVDGLVRMDEHWFTGTLLKMFK
jgi:hypothetical protein